MTGADEQSILILNVGSSTLKFGLFPLAVGDDPFLRGVLEYAGRAGGRLRVSSSDRAEEAVPLAATRESAAKDLLGYLERNSLFKSVRAVGHRLVHGGAKLRGPVVISDPIRAMIEEVIPLAPDHLPTELRAIDEVARFAPTVAQVACFDTAFHGAMPRVARLFGLPRALLDSGVIRYGFHGLSYEYVIAALRKRGELPARTIVAHLGNGASIAAVRDGVGIDTSMGLTPNGGMVMSTRSGDLDPGILLYLLRSRGFSAYDVDDTIKHKGGLLGISDSSSDVRDLLAARAADPKAEEAIGVFCYQAKKFIGGYAAVLGGLDALVFTGGIGERSPEIRAQICDGLGFLGLQIDAASNARNAETISTAGSKVRVRTMKANEEAMIAAHTRQAINPVLAGVEGKL